MMFSLNLHRLNVAGEAVCRVIQDIDETGRVDMVAYQHAIDACMRAGVITAGVIDWRGLAGNLELLIQHEEDKLMARYNNMAEQGILA